MFLFVESLIHGCFVCCRPAILLERRIGSFVVVVVSVVICEVVLDCLVFGGRPRFRLSLFLSGLRIVWTRRCFGFVVGVCGLVVATAGPPPWVVESMSSWIVTSWVLMFLRLYGRL